MTRRDLLPARLAASALFFGNGFGIGTWAAQLPRFKESLGLSDGQLSLGLLAFSLGAVALMPLIGWAVALVGSRLPGVYDVHALPAAVGLDEEERDRMEVYRPLFAAFWLAMLLPGNGSWRRNPPGTTEAQAEHFMGLLARH